jgi:hypothetical protein
MIQDLLESRQWRQQDGGGGLWKPGIPKSCSAKNDDNDKDDIQSPEVNSGKVLRFVYSKPYQFIMTIHPII